MLVSPFSANYLVDIPQALATPMRCDLGITESQNLLLYSSLSLPNTFMPFLNGIIISKIGSNWSLFILSTILLIGRGGLG